MGTLGIWVVKSSVNLNFTISKLIKKTTKKATCSVSDVINPRPFIPGTIGVIKYSLSVFLSVLVLPYVATLVLEDIGTYKYDNVLSVIYNS